MAVLDDQVTRAIQNIHKAKELADQAGDEYFAACERFDWQVAEEARLRIAGHLEAFLDHIAAVHKLLQVAPRGR